MEVAVRELKAKLSSYLKRAAGELITVTPASRRGLGPVRRASAQGSVLQALAEDRVE